jgi:hypothetical protein
MRKKRKNIFYFFIPCNYFSILLLFEMAVTKSIVRTDSLSTDRLNDEIDDDLILCPICTNILWKPITCKTCENSFCLKCMRLWLNQKPNKCPFNCTFEERKPPPILMKILSKLKLHCRHQSSGCLLLISYEDLEKHELQECQYRIIQCPGCLQEMLKKDFDIHEKEGCHLVQSTCLKCGIIYNQRHGHNELECLKKQILTVKEKLDATERKSKIMEENYHKMEEKYTRQQKNEEYAKRTLLHSHTPDC